MSLGLASRLARREVRRRPGRTLLVALLVALPTIALGGAAIIAATERNTPANNYRAHYGYADFVVDVGGPSVEGAPLDPAAALLKVARSVFGDATQVATLSYSSLAARVRSTTVGRGQRSKYLYVHTADLRDPLITPLYDLRAGRAPAAVGEVAVSTELADSWNLQPGDTLTLSRPALSATVVGVVRDRTQYSWVGLMSLPGNAFTLPENAGRSLLFVDTPQPVTYSQAARAVDDSLAALPERLYTAERNEFVAPSDPVLLLGSVFAVVGFAVLSIIVTAAFATSARRQLVTIGQLVSNGAPRRLVRTSLALQGAWSAAVGLSIATVVLGLGFGFSRSTLATLATVLGRDVARLRIPVGQLVAIAVIATVASTVAAYLPARSATRVSVLDALAGRRPLASVPRRLLPIGIVVFAAGVGLELLTTIAVTGRDGGSGSNSNAFLVSGAVGALLILGGMCCASPTIVSVLGPLSRKVRGTARLGARSIARSRPRTAAVVASIAAFAAVGVATSTFIITDRAHSGVTNAYLPDDVVILSANRCPNPVTGGAEIADVEQTSISEPCVLAAPDATVTGEVEEILGSATKAALRWATFDPAPIDPSSPPVTDALVLQEPGAIRVATTELLDLIGVSGGDRAGLAQSGILAIGEPGQWAYGQIQEPGANLLNLRLRTRSGDVDVQAATNRDPLRYYGLASFLITEAKAGALGLPIREAGTQYILPKHISEAQHVELSFLQYGNAVYDKAGTSLNIGYSYFRPATDSGIIEAAIALGVLVITLLIVAIGLALSATEGKDERDVLVAIGARPGTLSSLSGLRAFALSAFGVLLAIPVGLVPSLVVIRSSQAGEQIPEGPVVPWLTIVLLLGIPVVAYAVARAASSIGRRLRPVRMSNFAFD